MFLNDLFSEEKVMKISTRFSNDPNFEKYKSEAIEIISKSKDFTIEEKQFLISMINRIDKKESFKNKYIGFN